MILGFILLQIILLLFFYRSSADIKDLLLARDTRDIRDSIEKLSNNFSDKINSLRLELAEKLSAFKNPNYRGLWGEITLRTLIENSGLLPHCNFSTKLRMTTNDNKEKIPDLVIYLPNESANFKEKRMIFVDSKTPLDAFFKPNLSDEEFKKQNLSNIKRHIADLGSKQYWKDENSPEFVVLFLPCEGPWKCALDTDPMLIEYADKYNVIVTTPMTLIGLLKTIYYSWKQVKQQEENSAFQKHLPEFIECSKNLNESLGDFEKKLTILYRSFKGLLESQIRTEKLLKEISEVKN